MSGSERRVSAVLHGAIQEEAERMAGRRYFLSCCFVRRDCGVIMCIARQVLVGSEARIVGLGLRRATTFNG